MQESVIYQDILQKKKQQGALEVVTLLLTQRFGTIEENLQQRTAIHYSVGGFGKGIVVFLFCS